MLREARSFKGEFVDVAPFPTLARLDGSNDWVLCRVKMLRRVLVDGGITAADVPADQAHPEMNPRITRLEALLAAFRFRFYISNLTRMRTGVCHGKAPHRP